jgi:hypothetical protein
LTVARAELRALPRNDASLRHCERLLGRIQDLDPLALVTGKLHQVMNDLQGGLADLDVTLSDHYFKA